MQLINGRSYSFSEIAVSMNGLRFLTIKSLSVSDSVERGKLRGNCRSVLSKTVGVYDNEASIEVGFDEYWNFIRFLGDGYLNKQFHVNANFGADDGLDNHSIDFDAKIKKDGFDGSQSPEPLTVKFELDPIGRISRDGLDPVGWFNV